MRKTYHLAIALALLPASLAAQQPPGAEARTQTALAVALEAGIPVSLLENKIAEGRAKGVPMERIAIAVESRLNALLRARSVMERAGLESTTSGDLSIAADAVQAGVSETVLVEITRVAPQERRAVAVAVLANLVALGHASENALTQVRLAMTRGPDALMNMQARTAAELRARGAFGVEIGAAMSGNSRVPINPGRGRGRGNNN